MLSVLSPASGGVPSSPSSGVRIFAVSSSFAAIASSSAKYAFLSWFSSVTMMTTPFYSRIFVPPQSS